MRVLIEATVVRGPNGGAVVLAAGEPVPEWATEQVGDHLLDPAPAVQAILSEEDRQGDEQQDEDGDPPALPPVPPRSGSGSGLDAWRQYAAAAGVAVPQDATRADVIDLLDAAGVATHAGQ